MCACRCRPILMLAFILLASALNVLALGITPGAVEIGYKPGESHSSKFTISIFVGKLQVTFEGDLASVASVSEDTFFMDKPKAITVSYTLAEGLAPGRHVLRVVVTPYMEKQYGVKDSRILARAQIVGQIVTYIPYPEKYLRIYVGDCDSFVSEGDKAYFTIKVRNLGNQTIKLINGNLKIYDPQGSEVSSVRLTPVGSLGPLEKGEMYAEWDTSGVMPGSYKFRAFVNYDEGKSVNTSGNNIYVGKLELELFNITPKKAPNDKVTPVTVFIKNKWNQEVKFDIKLKVMDSGGKVLSESDGPLTEIGRAATKQVKVFLDTLGVVPGNYTLEVLLTTDDGHEFTNKFPFEILEGKGDKKVPQEEKPSASPVLYGILIVLVLIVVLLAIIAVYLYTKKVVKTGGGGNE